MAEDFGAPGTFSHNALSKGSRRGGEGGVSHLYFHLCACAVIRSCFNELWWSKEVACGSLRPLIPEWSALFALASSLYCRRSPRARWQYRHTFLSDLWRRGAHFNMENISSENPLNKCSLPLLMYIILLLYYYYFVLSVNKLPKGLVVFFTIQ